METQKIINLLNDSSNEESKFLTKTWYVIDSPTAEYKSNQKNSIKFKTESIKSRLCGYSDAIVLVTGDITVNADNGTDVTFKNCTPFSTCKTRINDAFRDEANDTDVAISVYILIE